MKKSVGLLLFFSAVIFLGVFLSVFSPQIKLEITIQPQYQSTIKAQEPDRVAEKPHCDVLFSDRRDYITDKINESYDKGYRLKSFAYGIDSAIRKFFAVVCKE